MSASRPAFFTGVVNVCMERRCVCSGSPYCLCFVSCCQSSHTATPGPSEKVRNSPLAELSCSWQLSHAIYQPIQSRGQQQQQKKLYAKSGTSMFGVRSTVAIRCARPFMARRAAERCPRVEYHHDNMGAAKSGELIHVQRPMFLRTSNL
jgi:hypothetical protein